jgi:hypothetical protein
LPDSLQSRKLPEVRCLHSAHCFFGKTLTTFPWVGEMIPSRWE